MGVTMDGGRSLSDAELLERARSGEKEAFESLYLRHSATVRRYALSLTRRVEDADDLVAEVFANLLSALGSGKGPTELVVPYVISSIKHEHWRSARRRARESPGDVDAQQQHCAVEDEPDRRDVAAEIAEADLVAAALSTLPTRAQELLWLTEVEETSVQLMAERDGMTPHAVAVSTHRARRALGSAYLAAHAAPFGGVAHLGPACRETVAHLASFVRGKVGVRRRRRIEGHLATCELCARNRDRLERINGRLRQMPQLPFQIGVGATSLGFKGELFAWLSASTVQVASSGAMALAVVVPMALPTTTGEAPDQVVAAADGDLFREGTPDVSRAGRHLGPPVVVAGRSTATEQAAPEDRSRLVDLMFDASDETRHRPIVVPATGDAGPPALTDGLPGGTAHHDGLVAPKAAGRATAAPGAELIERPETGAHEGSETSAGTGDEAAAAGRDPADTGPQGGARSTAVPNGGNRPATTPGQGVANGPDTSSGHANANGPDLSSGRGTTTSPTADSGRSTATEPAGPQGNANGAGSDNGQHHSEASDEAAVGANGAEQSGAHGHPGPAVAVGGLPDGRGHDDGAVDAPTDIQDHGADAAADAGSSVAGSDD